MVVPTYTPIYCSGLLACPLPERRAWLASELWRGWVPYSQSHSEHGPGPSLANLLTCAGASMTGPGPQAARQHPAVSIGFYRHRRWKETLHSCCAYCFHLALETCLCLPEGKCSIHPNAGTTTRNSYGDFYILKCRTCKSEIRVGLGMWHSSNELSMHTTTQTRNPTWTQSMPASPALGQLSILDHTVTKTLNLDCHKRGTHVECSL